MTTTRQAISVGGTANDGTGDTLRSAGQKINSNIENIQLQIFTLRIYIYTHI